MPKRKSDAPVSQRDRESIDKGAKTRFRDFADIDNAPEERSRGISIKAHDIDFEQANALPSPTPNIDQGTLMQAENDAESAGVFANARAKTAWELAEAVNTILARIPPEPQDMKAKVIRFLPEDRDRGVYSILFTGTVIGTPDKGAYIVPDRTTQVLDLLKIPYRLETR